MNHDAAGLELASPSDGALNRRDAIKRLVDAGLCACCAGLAAGCPAQPDGQPAAAPAARRPQPKGPQEIGRFSETELNQAKRFLVGEVPVWIQRQQDIQGADYLLVFDGRCPHARCKIEFLSVDKGYRCPCHGSRFTANGERVSGPARRNLRHLWYEVRNGAIFVDLEREMEHSQLAAEVSG